MTEQPLPGNEVWALTLSEISPIVNIQEPPTDAVIPSEKILWCQVLMPNTGDSEKEKAEFKNAQLEQLKLGILKMQQPAPQVQFNDPKLFSFDPETKNPLKGFSVQHPIQQAQRKPIPSKFSDLFGKTKKVGPNEPCTCGSGKKYKKCCGRGQ